MRLDPARLAALRQAALLDTEPEQVYEQLVQLLAQGLGVPIAMVNLLDQERDWFKACVGLPMRESPASTSFCETLFHTDDAMVLVPDTLLDPRFATHPLVQAPPHVRFYAAARLDVGGHTLGTLCAYDLQPRQLSAAQLDEFRALASAAVALIRGRMPSGAGVSAPG